MVYAYDEVGRLVAVTVAAEGSAVYHYDEVGNLVEVSRQPAGALSAFSVVPARAEAGDVVRVHGTGFSTRPGRNRVSVGGVSAEVVESTEYTLTVAVPDEASSGPVTVSVGRTAAAGELHLQVDQPPEVTSFSPEVVTPGDRLTVTGARFGGDAMVDMVVLADALYGGVESASSRGRFLSRDGLRQVRMTDADLAHPRQNPHINFETYNQPIGPGLRSGGPSSNIHIYLPGEPGWHLP